MRRLIREFIDYVREHPDEVLASIWQATRPVRKA